MPTVTLIDGRRVDSASEPWRHECEARHIASLPTRQARRDWLDAIGKRRGEAAMQTLEATVAHVFQTQRAHP